MFVSVGAFADEPPSPLNPSANRKSSVMTAQAQKLHDEGMAHFDRGEYAKAFAAFTAAYNIEKNFAIASALGAAELKLRNHTDAAKHLWFALSVFPEGGDIAAKDNTLALYDEAKLHVAKLTVTVTPPDATVSLDGEPLAPDDDLGALFVRPGKHKIVARHDGWQEGAAEVNATPKGEHQLELMLEPLSNGGGVPTAAVVTLFVTGGAASIAAAVLGGVAASNKGSANDTRALLTADLGQAPCTLQADPRCDDALSDLETHDALASAAVGLGVGGGVLLGTAVILLVISPDDKTAAVPILTPYFGARETGLVLSGTW